MLILKSLLWKIYIYRRGYPHKGHVRYLWKKLNLTSSTFIRGTYLDVAKAWAFDDSIYNISDLAMHFTMSRFRAEQLLKKFISKHF